MIEAAFPNRFSGGFSPPFDGLPPWLPETWHSMGGTFISWLGANSFSGDHIPVRRAGVGVWRRSEKVQLRSLLDLVEGARLRYLFAASRWEKSSPQDRVSRSARAALRRREIPDER